MCDLSDRVRVKVDKERKMSCRPAVGMPNTRQYIVRRLDSQEQEVNLQKKATGGECLDRVSPEDLSWFT